MYEDAKSKGVSRIFYKDYEKLDEFSDKVLSEIKKVS